MFSKILWGFIISDAFHFDYVFLFSDIHDFDKAFVRSKMPNEILLSIAALHIWRRALIYFSTALEQMAGKTIETPVIWDATTLIVASL